MTSYLLTRENGRYAFFEDADGPSVANRVTETIVSECDKGSINLMMIAGNPNDPNWKKTITQVQPYLAAGALIKRATVQEIMQTMDEIKRAERRTVRVQTQDKVRDMANETYVNRVKTSDRHQKAVLDLIKG